MGGLMSRQLRRRRSLDSARQLLSVLQQVALALAVAEEALQFEHRNLHAGHVLVKKTHDDTCRFRVGGRDIVVNTRGLRAHVTGYGLARMTDAAFHKCHGVGVATSRKQDRNCGSMGTDFQLRFIGRKTEKRGECNIPEITGGFEVRRRDEWGGFHPLTNVLYVLHLAEQLHRRYRRRFGGGDDDPQPAWTEVGRWRDRLPHYASLCLFVEDHFKTTPCELFSNA
ncbi:serine/threonine-protein kinase haspin-like [Dermacentor variabilis]|uniref:serine/threonine-protein kinase haspin-like n=1 Tax=Dermacentor variabilis TaxID=34621 RepID=UPI003F5B57E8